MPCASSSASSTRPFAFMWSANIVCACLLAAAGFSQYASAARTREERRAGSNPYVMLPPGLPTGEQEQHRPKSLGEKQFTLRHIYHRGAHAYPGLHRYVDIPSGVDSDVLDENGDGYTQARQELTVTVASMEVQRLAHRQNSDIEELLRYAQIHGEAASLPSSAWTVDEIAGPNISDKGTVLAFATMASNAYDPGPGEGNWRDVKGAWNHSAKFGWENDGLRGHIFADPTNSTVVIALKGTTVALFDGAETTTKDKENDNLFGSCCCAQGGQYWWHKVCDCMTSAYTCNSTCVVKNLHKKNRYYQSGLELYSNVTDRYPGADVWLTGHSLGGVVSSLLGLSKGNPTVTFEAYPDALAASRLGLPVPPGYRIGSHQSRANTGIFHVGHSADPIYMGTCNGASSWCTIGGYAFEGTCHTGQTCMYDTVKDKGWRVSAGTHRIHNVIDNVITQYETGPTCEEDVDCNDCFNWKFFESNGTETTTSSVPSTSTSTRTRTRTETCKTPGWWGCLDESSTSTVTSTSSTTSTSTSTCKTPGWFGCKDPTTTTSSSKTVVTTPSAAPAPSTTTASTSTTTCQTPGWFGCKDAVTTTSATAKPIATTAVPTASQTSTTLTASPSATNPPVQRQRKCRARHWYGTCKEWESVPLRPKIDL